MADGGIGNQSPATLFQARLDTVDGVSGTLTLRQYAGNKVVVAGLTVSVSSSGLSVDVTDNLIDAAGADAGAPPSPSTLYYVYISNRRSPFSPESIRLSATPPVLVNGVKYLGASGNALNWRFVGWVQPNATPEFESTTVNRLIVNYYNKRALSILVNPGYVNDDAYTSYLISSATFQKIHADAEGSFISNGEDAVALTLNYMVNTGGHGGNNLIGMGFGSDYLTSPRVCFTLQPDFNGNRGALAYSGLEAEGLVPISLLGVCSTGTDEIYADSARFGAVADPRSTMISGTIQG